MRKILVSLCAVALVFALLIPTCSAAVIPIGTSFVLAGDANTDGVTDSRDLVRIKRYIAGAIAEISAAAVDYNSDGTVNANDMTYMRQGILEEEMFVWYENVAESVNSLVFDANHWTAESKNYTLTDTGITMGNSDYVDAHYSSFYNAGTVSLTEDLENGNYITFTVPNSWNAAPVLRYGPNGVSDVSVATKGAEYVYMTVKFDADNLQKFQNAGAYSKNVIDSTIANYNYIADNAFVVALGSACGVTFTTWKAALKNITANEWTTLKLAITAGENVSVADTVKIFEFFFGKPADINGAQMAIKNIRVCTEDGVFATNNVNVAIEPSASLLISSVADKIEIPVGGEYAGCGTLLAYDTYNGDYSAFTANGENVNVIPAEKLSVDVNKLNFTAELTNIHTNVYNTDFVARPYIKYTIDGEETFIYGDAMAFNLNDVAKQTYDENISSEELTAQLKTFLDKYYQKSLKLNNGPIYNFVSNAWAPQLQIATSETNVDTTFSHIKLDVKCADIETILTNWTNGGGENTTGNGGTTYSSTTTFALYFSGTDVKVQDEYAIGVIKADLKNALLANRDALAKGDTVTLTLPLANGDKFKDTTVITGMNIMVTHGTNASAVAGINIGISNITFTNETTLMLKNGSDYNSNYTLIGKNWSPDLDITTDETAVTNAYDYIKMDIKCADIEKVLTYWTNAAKENINGTGNYTYDSALDLAIYFAGTDVKSQDEYAIGVVKNVMKNALLANQEALKNGETVTLTLPLANGDKIKDTTVITGMYMWVNHDAAANVADIAISISNVCFTNIAG